MKSKFHFLAIGVIMVFMNSCFSTKYVGLYINDKRVSYDIADSVANESLELRSDGIFNREVIYYISYGDDVNPQYKGCIYTGRYFIKGNQLYLTVDRTLRLDSTAIVRLTPLNLKPELTTCEAYPDTLTFFKHGVIRLGKHFVKQGKTKN